MARLTSQWSGKPKKPTINWSDEFLAACSINLKAKELDGGEGEGSMNAKDRFFHNATHPSLKACGETLCQWHLSDC